MRLFISINFNEEIKDAVYEVLEKLKADTVKGSFTYRENLHLTLVFIGEVPISQIDAIKTAMDRVKSEPFSIKLKDIGHFKRDDENIYWIGVEKNSKLIRIYKQLCDELTRLGFAIEKREYKPHLTLGRRVVVVDGFNEEKFSASVPAMEMVVENISLMKSERINGKLTYTEIYRKKL